MGEKFGTLGSSYEFVRGSKEKCTGLSSFSTREHCYCTVSELCGQSEVMSVGGVYVETMLFVSLLWGILFYTSAGECSLCSSVNN